MLEIYTNTDFNTFKTLINKGIKKYFNKEIKNLKFFYLASRDGYDNEFFHKKCECKSFTVTVIIAESNKIFGGFIKLEWDQSEKYKYGDKGFIFSINNNEIYYNPGKYFICGSKLYGPCFGHGFDIDINHKIGNDWTDSYSDFVIEINGKDRSHWPYSLFSLDRYWTVPFDGKIGCVKKGSVFQCPGKRISILTGINKFSIKNLAVYQIEE